MPVIDRTKSNLKIKQRTKKKIERNTLASERRKADKEIVLGANVIFGIDNGTTGSVACILAGKDYLDYQETPIKECLDYTQEVQRMSRIDCDRIKKLVRKTYKSCKKTL
jgi:hypothetical protein